MQNNFPQRGIRFKGDVVAQKGMWWLNGSAPDCKTCSPGFESGISPTCRDMSFLFGEPAGLA